MHLSFLYWDPQPIAFTLPFFNHPIAWYGILFAGGFFLGFLLLRSLLEKFFSSRPEYTFEDIKDWEQFKQIDPKLYGGGKKPESFLKRCNELLMKELEPIDLHSFNKREKALLQFAKNWFEPSSYQKLANRLLLEKKHPLFFQALRNRASQFTEKLAFYLMLGTVLGARIGHLLFYENWTHYLRHPLLIFKTWEGGLASHGGLIGIALALLIFLRRWKKKIPSLSFFLLLDFLVAPAFLCGMFIRLGNFINQEIVGKVTSVPWAVVFKSPAGGLLPLPRHPVQLYEAFFYLAAFLFFLYFFPSLFSQAYRKLLSKESDSAAISNMSNYPGEMGQYGGHKNSQNLKTCGIGMASSYAITLTFLFRFFIEFFKEEQSRYLFLPYFTMGQYLSLPMIFLGIFFLFSLSSRLQALVRK